MVKSETEIGKFNGKGGQRGGNVATGKYLDLTLKEIGKFFFDAQIPLYLGKLCLFSFSF